MTTWFPIVGGPLAWFVQAIVAWLAAEWTCELGGPSQALVVGASATALAVALAALCAAALGWRRSGEARLFPLEGRTPPSYSAGWGLLISLCFVVAVVATALPALVLAQPCEAIR